MTGHEPKRWALGYYLLLVSVITFSSCSKGTGISSGFRLNQGMKDFYDWQPGSYWILQDSVTGSIDSLLVLTNVQSTGSSMGYTDEIITVTMKQMPANNPADTTTWKLLLSGGYNNALYYQKGSTSMYFGNIVNRAQEFYRYDTLYYGGIAYDSAYRNEVYYTLGSVPDNGQKMTVAVDKAYGFLYLKTSAEQGAKTYFRVKSRIIR